MSSLSVSAAVTSHAPVKSARLLDQLRERIRAAGYSLRSEDAHVHWVRSFIRWSGMRHPRDMGVADVRSYLDWLGSDCNVSAATRRRALRAIGFLYREVLGRDLGLQRGTGVAAKAVDAPAPRALAVSEVGALLGLMDGDTGLAASLSYGAGLRPAECVSLRIRDIDLARRLITVRQGRAGGDRVVMLPRAIEAAIRDRIRRASNLWERDRTLGVAGVDLPDALERKYPRASQSLDWFWVFPASELTTDSATDALRREHLSEMQLGGAIRSAARAAGIEGRITAHALRQSFAEHLLRDGTDARTVSALLGDGSSERAAPPCAAVLKFAAAAVASPLDKLRALHAPQLRLSKAGPVNAHVQMALLAEPVH